MREAPEEQFEHSSKRIEAMPQGHQMIRAEERGPAPIERFERWYGKSIEKLRELPDGDGAFAALMIAFPLYERCMIGKLKLEGKSTGEDELRQAFGEDLNLEDWQRRIFWAMFRNGFTHQAMPIAGKTMWRVSHVYEALPKFHLENGVNCICLEPWKFTDRVLDKFRADHRLITASESFPLADIFQLPLQSH